MHATSEEGGLVSFMSFEAEAFEDAAQDLKAVGAAIRTANAEAAASTTQLTAAAQDEVSQGIATVFSDFGQDFQALNAEVQQFGDQFVETLETGATAYATTESLNLRVLGLSVSVGPLLKDVASTVYALNRTLMVTAFRAIEEVQLVLLGL